MLNSHPDFKYKSAKKQLDYCVTILLMITQTVRQHVNENMPMAIPKPIEFPYSINWLNVKNP
jgi:hypothetical protein